MIHVETESNPEERHSAVPGACALPGNVKPRRKLVPSVSVSLPLVSPENQLIHLNLFFFRALQDSAVFSLEEMQFME